MSEGERFSQVAHQKWANEQIAQNFEQIAHISSIFSKKTDERISNPASPNTASDGLKVC